MAAATGLGGIVVVPGRSFVAAWAAILALVCCCALTSCIGGAQAQSVDDATPLGVAYRKFSGLHALEYWYTAGVQLSTMPLVTGTINVTVTGSTTVSSVAIVNQDPAVLNASTPNVTVAALPVDLMFRRLYANLADAEPNPPNSLVYDPTRGYPFRYRELGASVSFITSILSLTITRTDPARDSAVAQNNAAARLWAASGIASYHFKWSKVCASSVLGGLVAGCRNVTLGGAEAPVIVSVHTGAISTVANAMTGAPMSDIGRYMTFPQLLTAMSYAANTSDMAVFVARYDSTLGYPQFFAQSAFDSDELAPATITVSDFGRDTVEESEGEGRRWIVGIVILILIIALCCLCGYLVHKYRNRDKITSQATDRTAAGVVEMTGIGAATMPPPQRSAPSAAAMSAPTKSGGAVDYEV